MFPLIASFNRSLLDLSSELSKRSKKTAKAAVFQADTNRQRLKLVYGLNEDEIDEMVEEAKNEEFDPELEQKQKQ